MGKFTNLRRDAESPFTLTYNATLMTDPPMPVQLGRLDQPKKSSKGITLQRAVEIINDIIIDDGEAVV